MNLNTFADILELTKKRCNVNGITDFDDIIATGINEAYMELKKKEPTVNSTNIVGINKVAVLPEDCYSILSIDPQLYADEYKLGKNLILQRDGVDFSIVYTVVPDILSGTDIPEINKKYWFAMSTYGCFTYYQHKKKHQEAQSYMQAYLTQVEEADSNNMLQNQIQNVYSIYLR